MCTINKNSKLYGEFTSVLQTLDNINASKPQLKTDCSKLQAKTHQQQHASKSSSETKNDEGHVMEMHAIIFLMMSWMLSQMLKVTSNILEWINGGCERHIDKKVAVLFNSGSLKFTFTFENFKVLVKNVLLNFNLRKALRLTELLALFVCAVVIKFMHLFVKILLVKVPV
jgi:hypothetical protein